MLVRALNNLINIPKIPEFIEGWAISEVIDLLINSAVKIFKKEGGHGPIYQITKGVQVKRDINGSWVLFINKNGLRTNRTIGKDREALKKAIKAAEKISQTLTKNPVKKEEVVKQKTHDFKEYSKDWLLNNSGRWHVNTYSRYEEVLRLHILPDPDIRTVIFSGRLFKDNVPGIRRRWKSRTRCQSRPDLPVRPARQRFQPRQQARS